MLATADLPRTKVHHALASIELHEEIQTVDSEDFSEFESCELDNSYFEDEYIHNIRTIVATIEPYNKRIVVGRVLITVIDTEMYGEIFDFLDYLLGTDECDGELYTIFSNIADIYGDDILDGCCDLFSGKVAVLTTLEVYPEYRGQGVGGVVLDKLKGYLKEQGIKTIFLIPAPLSLSGNKVTWSKKREKLINFYRNHNFKVLAATDSNDYVATLQLGLLNQ